MALVERISDPAGPRRYRAKNPATLDAIGEFTAASDEEVRAAVAAARAAQPQWAATDFRERRRIMEEAVRVLVRDQDEFLDVIVKDTGRSRGESVVMEILATCDSLQYNAKHARKVLKDRTIGMHLLRMKKLKLVYEPLGVVGIITPWNGPFVLGVDYSVQALMAGNAVVLKPSEVTPFAGGLVGELFRRAGLPEGLLQIVLGDGTTGAALVESDIDKIHFTGSTRTGRKVGEACGRNLVPCTLELGGKDAMIVCEDANIERAARGAVYGSMFNAGQFCCATERVYVHENIAQAFTDRVVEVANDLTMGTSGAFDIGSMIWPGQLEVIERHVADAVERGARLLAGGRRASDFEGFFFEPTVMDNVDHGMEIMRDETFGPVLPIMTVSGDEEAIRWANDSNYGLSGTVWSRDKKRAIAIARQVDTGSVCVNETSVTFGAPEAPFGGRKSSGVGRAHGKDGLRSFCHAKPIIIDRFGLKEEHNWYPLTDEKRISFQKAVKAIWGTRLGRWMS